MFYNGFTLLMQLLAGVTMYWVGNYYGRIRGERESHYRQERIAKYFSDVSKG